MPAITNDRNCGERAVVRDVARGTYPRLSQAAVERAKSRLGISDLTSLAVALEFSQMNFWRVRVGTYDIRYSHALRVAKKLEWPLTRVFEGGQDA
jgi:hypothetical protein